MAHARAGDGASLWFDVLPPAEPLPPGGPTARPVLLVPGRTLDHRMWLPFLTDLAPSRPVVLVDPRGTGDSEDRFPGDGAWGTEDQARDLLAVLDAARGVLGPGPVHVLGFSMGGRASQWLAATWPERLASLVLASTAVADRLGPRRSRAADDALRSGAPADLADLFYPPDWVAAHPQDAADSVLPRTRSRAAMLAHARASVGHDAAAAVARVTASTLVVHGADDVLTDPEHGRVLARHVPGARYLEVPGARHACWVDPGGVGAAGVREHLAAHDRPVGG